LTATVAKEGTGNFCFVLIDSAAVQEVVEGNNSPALFESSPTLKMHDSLLNRFVFSLQGPLQLWISQFFKTRVSPFPLTRIVMSSN